MNSSNEDVESQPIPKEQAPATETVVRRRSKRVYWQLTIALVTVLAACVAIAVTRVSSNKVAKVDNSDDGSWKQIGADLEGETTDDWFGSAVAFSANGQTLAVGAFWNMNVNGRANAGQVRVFERAPISRVAWMEANEEENDAIVEERWRQIGTELEGDNAVWGTFGAIVGLSSNGEFLTAANGCCDERHIRAFQLTDPDDKPYYAQVGQDLVFPEKAMVSLSTDSNSVAVVASGSSRATVFRRAQSDWEEIGTIDVNATDIVDGIRVETLVGDGSLVAVGNKRGVIRVFGLVESEYVQVGQDLDVNRTEDDQFYRASVRFAANGRVLAIGAPEDLERSGRVRVFSLNDNDDKWMSVGGPALIGGTSELFGYSVSLSSDGSILAVGAGGDYARVFRIGQDSSYRQLGQDLPSKGRGEVFGYALSLSANGTLVAVGGPSDDGTQSDSGYVRVFEWQE